MGTNKVKLLAAGAGAVAVVTFGAVGAQTIATASASASKMNVGQTSVESTPPTAPLVPMAIPKIKGPAPLPTEEEAAK